ncbi:hypothetical protein [Promicromonospora sp. NPDC050262]|uniref:NACHT domain-containing protein n=1 Tax=Promicromonospora sp. NPDC050262 TaxID=3155036 RepID=UPI0033DF65B3
MDYLYENLTPDQFQYLAQSMMLHRYPDLQCYPIGQPDGGRDGYSSSSSTVLQVKFKRRDEESSADWMITALEGELPKIENLISRGAKQYIMVTNARGTAHLDRGSVDRVKTWIDDHITVPTEVLWRDDVSRRLETMTALALQYPAMLKFTDGLSALISGIFDAEANRRIDTLRRFVQHQQQQDRKVKLQQVQDVQLDSDLGSIFVDIPLGIPREILDSENDRRGYCLRKAVTALADTEVARAHDRVAIRDGFSKAQKPPVVVDAGALLMFPEVQAGVTRILLHGAPGQGKSTLAQYVCQEHRTGWLKTFAASGASPLPPSGHSGLRLPVRVDLTQMGAFLADGTLFGTPPASVRSMETFLAKFVEHSTGGNSFSTDDVSWMLRSLPVLLFLDGLDEVADLKSRQQVVDAIAEGLARCPENGDIQVVATSRPSIFGATADFTQHEFLTLELQPLSAVHIDQLAKRWMDARKKFGDGRREFTLLLDEKLEQPHIKDLVRSPMQLTIILSLIDMNGTMLPDGRTDLYEKYLEQVMVREGNKSKVVAEHRDILVDFLSGLAWDMQLAAEVELDNGSLTLSDLQEKAALFLAERNEPGELVPVIFTGSERMYVLVARLQERYEFEVLPLQEFLCARHLHRTKPVRESWDPEPSGDLVRRFVTVTANPRWLNVARFLVGMYEPGELAGISFGLKDLLVEGSPAARIQARAVGQMVLADRIFRNRRSYQEEVAALAYDWIGAHLAHRTGVYAGPAHMFSDVAGEVVGASLVALIDDAPSPIHFWPLANILRRIGHPGVLKVLIERAESSRGRDRTDWLWLLSLVGMPDDPEVLESVIELVSSDSPGEEELSRRVGWMMRVRSGDLGLPADLLELYVNEILDNGVGVVKYRPDSWLEFFETVAGWTEGYRYRTLSQAVVSKISDWVTPDDVDSGDSVLNAFARAVARRWVDADELPRERWMVIGAAAISEAFPGRWLPYLTAIQCARDLARFEWFDTELGKPGLELAAVARDGFSDEGPEIEWWRSEFRFADDPLRRRFALLLALTAGKIEILIELADDVDAVVKDLSAAEFDQFWGDMHRFREGNMEAADIAPAHVFCGDAAVLVGGCLGVDPGEFLRLDPSSSERLAEWHAVEDWYHKVRADVEWDDVQRVRDWLDLVNSRPRGASDRNVEPTAVFRDKLSAETAAMLLQDGAHLQSEVIETCIDIVMRAYSPEPVRNVVEREEWKFVL